MARFTTAHTKRELDRAALPKEKSISRSTDFIPQPQTDAEQALARIWIDLLEFSHRNYDIFFDLGAIHARDSSRICLRDDLGVELPLRKVFLNPPSQNSQP